MAPPRSIVMGSVNTTTTQTTIQIVRPAYLKTKSFYKNLCQAYKVCSQNFWQKVTTCEKAFVDSLLTVVVSSLCGICSANSRHVWGQLSRNMWGTAVEIRYNICRQQDMPQFAMQHSKFNIHVYSAVHLIRVGGLVLGTLYLESHRISNSLDHHQLLAGFY